jgi:outer membrane lipoprotein SlyB
MKKLLTLLLCPLLLASCAQNSMTGDAYTRSGAGSAQSVQTGRIVSIRNVRIEGGTGAGTVLGGIAGGFLGSEIGSGSGRTIATVAGSALGAAAGSQAQKNLGGRNGIEIDIALDSGKRISVVQEVNPREPFAVGERVRVLSGRNGTKVTH